MVGQGRNFIESFNAALEGFIYVLKTERNMRIHFLIAVLFLLLGVAMGFSYLEITVLCLTIALVLAAEMFNTVLELLVDMVKSEFHPVARIIKDVSAGAVLITAINASIVGYILFVKKIPFDIENAMVRIKQSPWHATFLAIILILGVVVLGKVILHKGTPLRGGMPSGHAAIAFSILTIIAFLTNNSIVIALSFVMAFLIARHRIKDAVHTFWEVFVGSVLGILLTILVFQIFH